MTLLYPQNQPVMVSPQALHFSFARVGPGSRNFNGNGNRASMDIPFFIITSFQSAHGLLRVLEWSRIAS